MHASTLRTLVAALAVPAAMASHAAPPAPAAEINLSSYANGAWILKKPAEYDATWSAFWLLDERSSSGWATPKGELGPQVLLVALAERSLVKALEFDSASTDGDAQGSRSAKDVLVEVSDQGPEAGFVAIASLSLKPKLDKQRFTVGKPVPGRWLRLTVKSNHGSPEYIELMDFRALGEQLTRTPPPALTGTYQTNYNLFHLQQDGASVSGCYEWANGLVVNGGLEGRVTRFTWVQDDGRGPAVLAFSPDGKEMLGLWWTEGNAQAAGQFWSGQKISDAVGSCPHWKPGKAGASQLAGSLAQAGRARLYGINFDTDSDAIKPESKAAINEIVVLAREQPGWKFTIEGHTDSTATAAHNQTLSEQRAAAVKAQLVAAGVPAARLATKGLGASQPVADNGSTIGRAQNRRVELVKN
jgi:outer membrane protein OmpA-like peptidoglycan-associated protein